MGCGYNKHMKKVNRDEDRRVARALMAGDKKELRRFYKTYQPRLMAYVTGKVGNRKDAEEIVQDSLVGFLEGLPLFGFRSSLWTFLVSIARHEVADHYRKLYAKKAIKKVPFMDQIYTEPVYEVKETVEFFYKAMERMGEKEKRILLWKYEEKLSVSEIAQKLGVGVKAAESRLFRARQEFQSTYLAIVEENG